MDWLTIFFDAMIMLAVLSVGMAIYWWTLRPASPVDARLKEINPRASEELATPPVSKVIVERVAKPLAQLVPPSPRNVRRLRRRLMRAGYLSENAVSVFGAIRLGLGALFPAVTA